MRRKLVIIVRSFAQGAYPVPARIAEAVRAPYILLRDLVVIDHPMSHVIDKVLMDAVSGGPGALALGRWGRPGASHACARLEPGRPGCGSRPRAAPPARPKLALTAHAPARPGPSPAAPGQL